MEGGGYRPHGSDINDVAYGCVKGTGAKHVVAAFDLEKAAHHGASGSGELLANGGILSETLRKVGSSPPRCYLHCIFDAVCKLKDLWAFIYN